MSSVKSKDLCVTCSKIVKDCHKDIICKSCNGFVHKKCTKLTVKQLKTIDKKEWTCKNCIPQEQNNDENFNDSIRNDVEALNASSMFNISDVDLKKYDDIESTKI